MGILSLPTAKEHHTEGLSLLGIQVTGVGQARNEKVLIREEKSAMVKVPGEEVLKEVQKQSHLPL